jgi:hypothetical protein
MGNRSSKRHYENGSRINDRAHGTCEHQWLDGKCVRCEQRKKRAEIKAEAKKIIAKKGKRVVIEKAKKKTAPK